MRPFLLAAALGVWGFTTGLWWLALPLAALAELPRFTRWRFELAARERQRVADLCTLVILLVGAWQYLTQPHLGVALILLIQWLPALMFPLLAVQLFDERDGLELSVLFLSLRGEGSALGGDLFDLRWPYLLLCALSAAMVPAETASVYPALLVLATLALASLEPLAAPRRLAALALAALIGLGIAHGLRWGHAEVEDWILRWVEYWMGTSVDPFRSTTALGEVGTLKGSESIRLRVYPGDGDDAPASAQAPPPLLRTASYDRYVNGTWFSTGSGLEPLARDDRGEVIVGASALAAAGSSLSRDQSHQLGTPRVPTGAASPTQWRILLSPNRREGLLPVPAGTRRIANLGQDKLQADGLRRSDLGTIRYALAGRPPVLGYLARVVAPDPIVPPGAADLRVPPPLQPAINRFSRENGLDGLPPARALSAIEAVFVNGFRYSLDLPAVPSGAPPIGHFLLVSKTGHCEYFASAAAMVLRHLGIPARYARGWSAQEYSGLEQAWIARDRHAHAWVQVWLDGAWRDFDPTPPDWGALESAGRPWYGPLSDRISWLRLQLTGTGNDDDGKRIWLILLLALLSAILVWRIARRGRRRRGAGPQENRRLAERCTPFTPLEHAMREQGHGRHVGETLREWAERLVRDDAPQAATLMRAVDLHYRASFDPAGLDADDRSRLRRVLRQLAAATQRRRPKRAQRNIRDR